MERYNRVSATGGGINNDSILLGAILNASQRNRKKDQRTSIEWMVRCEILLEIFVGDFSSVTCSRQKNKGHIWK